MKQVEVQQEIPSKKDTVRVSKKDLLKLLSENEHQAKQITELQARMSQMQEEIRALKFSKEPVPLEELKIVPKELTPKDIEDILKPVRNSHPYHRSDVYFDGRNGR
jgi:hypothetical protein